MKHPTIKDNKLQNSFSADIHHSADIFQRTFSADIRSKEDYNKDDEPHAIKSKCTFYS